MDSWHKHISAQQQTRLKQNLVPPFNICNDWHTALWSLSMVLKLWSALEKGDICVIIKDWDSQGKVVPTKSPLQKCWQFTQRTILELSFRGSFISARDILIVEDSLKPGMNYLFPILAGSGKKTNTNSMNSQH